MSDFEYVVGFYALLLGLAVANVVIGFADMWRERERLEIGWCPPPRAPCSSAAMNLAVDLGLTAGAVRRVQMSPR